MLNAIQFTVAHEIFHKAGSINKILGTLHMSKNLYTHFTYEHLYGHHRKVATPDDPASAPQHSDVYSFAWRSVKGTLMSVYNMELEAGKKIYENCAVLSVAWSIVFTAVIYAFFGFHATTFFLIQAFVSIFFLETINYIEHYGLRRKQLEDGSYEKVTIRHSWNAPHRFTNYILFKLQRHSDHHENAMKPYQTLLSLKESPQLPHGYSLMILMAFVPSVWFRIMDPLVDEYKKTGHGAIKSEVTEKAIQKSKEFAVVMGAMALATWGFDMLI
jgi:alkane 1-monooxygenase